MLLMMATYGLGAAEVLGLQIEAVDWKSEVLRVRRPRTGAWIELPLLPPVATTQIYLEASLAMKEKALAKTSPPHAKPGRYKPGDRVLTFLNSL